MFDHVIDTPRLRLRSTRLDDVEALHDMWSRPEVMAHLPAAPMRRDQVEAYVRRDVEMRRGQLWTWMPIELALEEKRRARVIGWCGLSPLAPRPDDVEVTCAVHPARWGRGYAREAVRAVLGYAFEVLGLPRLLAVVGRGNTASRRAVQALGFRLEGPLLDVPVGHVLRDREVYVMPRHAWLDRRTPLPGEQAALDAPAPRVH